MKTYIVAIYNITLDQDQDFCSAWSIYGQPCEDLKLTLYRHTFDDIETARIYARRLNHGVMRTLNKERGAISFTPGVLRAVVCEGSTPRAFNIVVSTVALPETV